MSERALLVIADIGGYTRFMKLHRVSLAHAQTVIAMLLEAVIATRTSSRSSRPSLDASASLARRSFLQKFRAWFKMTLRAIPYFVNKRKSCDGFRNFPGIEPPVDPTLILPPGVPSMTPPSIGDR